MNTKNGTSSVLNVLITVIMEYQNVDKVDLKTTYNRNAPLPFNVTIAHIPTKLVTKNGLNSDTKKKFFVYNRNQEFLKLRRILFATGKTQTSKL